MGVLRQKCVPTYEAFLNNSNFGFNMSYQSYLKQIDNESTLTNCLLNYTKILIKKKRILKVTSSGSETYRKNVVPFYRKDVLSPIRLEGRF
jgi:hypothetical protein